MLGHDRPGGSEVSVRGSAGRWGEGPREPGTARPCAAAFTAGNNAFSLISHYLSYLITPFLCLSRLVDGFCFRICECSVRKCCLFVCLFVCSVGSSALEHHWFSPIGDLVVPGAGKIQC